jgi:hypothetical protein
MDQKTKMRMLQQVEKVFKPNIPALLSIVFAWGEMESFGIIDIESLRRQTTMSIKADTGKILSNWRYGHFTAKVWIRELTKNLFIDEVKRQFEIIHQIQIDNLTEEKNNLEKALEAIKKYSK